MTDPVERLGEGVFASGLPRSYPRQWLVPAMLVCLYPQGYARAQETPQETFVELEAVVVEETGNPEPKLPLGIGISGETLSKAPGSGGDPLRTLQSIPGMAFTDDESAVPAVRGSRPGDNYFQTDFVPAGYLFHAGGAISVYNPSLVKSFSIYPSAYGAEFHGVTGGIFDVELREPKTDRFHATVDLSFLHAGALVEGPINENQSFYFGGRMSLLDIFIEDQLPDEDGIQFTQFPKYTDYQGKYVWNFDSGVKLTAQINGATDELDVNVAEDSEEIDTEPVFAGRTFEKESFNEQSLIWDHVVHDQIAIKTALSHSIETAKGQAGGAGNFDIKDDTWLLKSRATFEVNSRHEMTTGVQVAQSEIDVDLEFNAPACSEFEADCQISNAERLATNETIDVVATQAFVQDNWSITDKLTLFPGITVHGEDYLDEQFIEPRLALEYNLSDSLLLTAGTGLYHQFPGFLEINQVFGNPDLEYIESVQGVVGLQKTFSDGWDVKSELYYKQLENLVSGNDDTRYDNSGEGKAYGLDLLIRKTLTDRASGWLSASFSKATRTDADTGETFVFEYDQPYNVSLVAQYKLSEKWTIGAKYWFHSGAPYTPVIGATPDDTVAGLYNPQYGEINSERFSDYNRLDVRLDRTFQRKKGRTMSAYIEVLNILGNENIAEFDYSADYSEKETVEQLPTFVALGFKATY